MKLKQLPYYSPLGSKLISSDEYCLPFYMGVAGVSVKFEVGSQFEKSRRRY